MALKIRIDDLDCAFVERLYIEAKMVYAVLTDRRKTVEKTIWVAKFKTDEAAQQAIARHLAATAAAAETKRVADHIKKYNEGAAALRKKIRGKP